MEYNFFYFQLRTKSSKRGAVKLWPIISYNCLRNFEPIDDVFTKKLRDVLIFDAGVGFYLYPFGEVVGGHKQEFLLIDYDRQGPYYVHHPLREWPRAHYWVENFGW